MLFLMDSRAVKVNIEIRFYLYSRLRYALGIRPVILRKAFRKALVLSILGQVTVADDACAAVTLRFQDTVVPGDMVHATFMVAIGMQGAQVVATSEVVLDKPEN